MTDFYKYKRTYHLPWSLGSTNDDKFLNDTSAFLGKEIVITEKMDGENTSMYFDRVHARSIDSKDHDSRHWVKGLWGQIRNDIPTGWRICGENLYAKHSLSYNDLSTYFMVFSIWNENNICLSWKDTVDVCDMLNLTPVPIIDTIIYNENYLKKLALDFDVINKEGFVIRNINEFSYDDFSDNVAKWVRAMHVNTDQHWMFQEVIPNKLKR